MEPALGGVGAAKEVLQNSTSICTTAPWSWQLHGVLELGCLAGKLAGVAGVQLQSHAKHPLSVVSTEDIRAISYHIHINCLKNEHMYKMKLQDH